MKKTRGPTKRYSINYERIYGKGKTPNDERIKKLKSEFNKDYLFTKHHFLILIDKWLNEYPYVMDAEQVDKLREIFITN